MQRQQKIKKKRAGLCFAYFYTCRLFGTFCSIFIVIFAHGGFIKFRITFANPLAKKIELISENWVFCSSLCTTKEKTNILIIIFQLVTQFRLVFHLPVWVDFHISRQCFAVTVFFRWFGPLRGVWIYFRCWWFIGAITFIDASITIAVLVVFIISVIQIIVVVIVGRC